MAKTLTTVLAEVNSVIQEYLDNNQQPPHHLLLSRFYLSEATGTTSETLVLGTFRATNSGTGYSSGDIIVLFQEPPAAPYYYNTTTSSNISPNTSHLGPVGSSSNVTVTSGTVTANLGTIGDVATQTTLAEIRSAVAGTLTVNGSGNTQPISASSLPLPTGAAQNTTLQEVRDLLSQPTDAPAITNIGTGSILAFIKRLTAHLLAPRLYVATAITTSGDNTIIAAPAAGTRIVITKIRIQGTSGLATSVLLKNGATTVIARLRTTQDGSGLSEVYGFSDAIRLSAARAFILNLSAANAHSVSLEYYLESTSTGLPL